MVRHITHIFTIHTSLGDIKLNVFANSAPHTVETILGLAQGTLDWVDPKDGSAKSETPFYDGIQFHRVIKGFMIQFGCKLANGTSGPGFVYDDEIDHNLTFDLPYMLAMANAGKHMGKGTNGSQMFITTAPTPWLQGRHTIFGEVATQESKDVVDKIQNTQTDSFDKPLAPITILKTTVEEVKD